MNTTYTRLLELLNQKLELFIEYDRVSDELLQLDDDEVVIEKLMNDRDRLASRIDSLDDEIKDLSNEQNFAYSYILNYAEFSNTEKTAENSDLIEKTEKIFDIIRGLRLKNTDINSKFETIKLRSLEKIKKNSHAPNIATYFQNLKIVSDGNNFGRG